MLNTQKALTLYQSEIKKLLTRAEKKVQKERDKVLKKNAELLEEYPNEQEVMESFGWGYISNAKKNKILNLLEIKNGKSTPISSKTTMELYLEMLTKDYETVTKELNLFYNE